MQSNEEAGSNGMNLKQQKEKFQRYLTLLFHDLCAKTNGLTKKEIDEYTFMKVLKLFAYNFIVFITTRVSQHACVRVDEAA